MCSGCEEGWRVPVPRCVRTGACARCRGGGGLHEEPCDLHRVEHPPELLHDETRMLDVLVHLRRVWGTDRECWMCWCT